MEKDIKVPKISMLILTYNRAHIVERAIESVLKQSYKDYELVIVNNGSIDNTKEILSKYESHKKIRIFHLEKNRQCPGGHNYGFDQMQGEWFGAIGDDDTLMEDAFETMMRVLDEVDPSITGITSNALNSSTRAFAGYGLNEDQYLPLEKIVRQTSGEFFALNKLELLGDLRFNEKLLGEENALWYQLDAKAKRYYIHKALKVWYTDSEDSETTRYQTFDLQARATLFTELLKEKAYWNILKEYDSHRFYGMAVRGFFFLKSNGQNLAAQKYQEKLQGQSFDFKHLLFYQLINLFPSSILNKACLLGQNNSFNQLVSKFKTNRFKKSIELNMD